MREHEDILLITTDKREQLIIIYKDECMKNIEDLLEKKNK